MVNDYQLISIRLSKAYAGAQLLAEKDVVGCMLASCGDDGAIVLWDLHTGEPLQTLRRDRPYERLNITGIWGLSEAQKTSLYVLGAFVETNIGG